MTLDPDTKIQRSSSSTYARKQFTNEVEINGHVSCADLANDSHCDMRQGVCEQDVINRDVLALQALRAR